MKKSALVFTLLFVNIYLFSQQRLTEIENGFVQQNLTYLGTDNSLMYYINETEGSYQILSERLDDNELQSELLYQYDKGNESFNAFAYHDEKIIMEGFDQLVVYNTNTHTVQNIAYDFYFGTDDAIYGSGKAYLPTFEGLVVIDLETGELQISEEVDEFLIEEFLFNDETNNVLKGTSVPIYIRDYQNNTEKIVEVDLVTGAESELHNFTSSDFYITSYLTQDAFHFQVVNLSEDTHRLYSFISGENGYEKRMVDIEFSPSFEVEVISNDYFYVRESETIGEEIISTIYMHNLITGDYYEKVVSFDPHINMIFADGYGIYTRRVENSQTILRYEPFDNNASKDIFTFDDPFTFIDVVRSEYSIAEIDVDGKYLANVELQDGTVHTLSFNRDEATLVSDDLFVNEFYDEANKSTILLMINSDNEAYLSQLTASGITQLQEDEAPQVAGGSFIANNETEIPFIYSNDNVHFDFYTLKDGFNTVENDIGISVVDAGQSGEDLILSTENFSFNLLKIEAGSNTIVPFGVNETGFITMKDVGYAKEFLPVMFRISGKERVGSINTEGNLTVIFDPQNPDAYETSFFYAGIISANGNAYTLVTNQENNGYVPIKIGKNLEETQILFDDPDFYYFTYFDLLAEGENYSFMDAGKLFFVHKDNDAIKFLPAGTNKEVSYSDGRFYFNDKYFDDTTGEFVDLDLDLSSLVLVNNNVAYGKSGESLEMVNVNTLKKESFEIGFGTLRYFATEYGVYILNITSKALFYTDGTAAGSIDISSSLEEYTIVTRLETLNDKWLVNINSAEIGSELVLIDKRGDVTEYDINPGTGSSNPKDFVFTDDALYFSAVTQQYGRQLYSIDFDGILSVESDITAIAPVEVFPNPASDFITIDRKYDYDRIEIFDAMGQSVFKNSNTDHTINMTNFSSGAYIIQFFLKGTTIGTSKILKQ